MAIPFIELWMGFNPRPAFMAGRSNCRCASIAARTVSIRVRPSWPDDRRTLTFGPSTTCFNPRPAFMAGRSPQSEVALYEFGVSIRVRPSWPDDLIPPTGRYQGQLVSIRVRPSWPDDPHYPSKAPARRTSFNPRPAFMAGRSRATHPSAGDGQCFNPRPAFMAGRSQTAPRPSPA